MYNNFFVSFRILIIKNTFKIALQYPFKTFILFKTYSYLKLSFILEIDKKNLHFQKLEEIQKT